MPRRGCLVATGSGTALEVSRDKDQLADQHFNSTSGPFESPLLGRVLWASHRFQRNCDRTGRRHESQKCPKNKQKPQPYTLVGERLDELIDPNLLGRRSDCDSRLATK